MADEQELLSDEFTEQCLEYDSLTMRKIMEFLTEYGDKPIHSSSVKGWVSQAYRLGSIAQVAKLKAMGYEQVWEKCPECDGRALKASEAERTGKIPDDLDVLPMDADCPACKGAGRKRKLVKWDTEKVANLFKDRSMSFPYMKTCYEFADQLKEILMGGE